MKTLEKVSDFVGKYMAGIVIVVAAPNGASVLKTAFECKIMNLLICEIQPQFM